MSEQTKDPMRDRVGISIGEAKLMFFAVDVHNENGFVPMVMYLLDECTPAQRYEFLRWLGTHICLHCGKDTGWDCYCLRDE